MVINQGYISKTCLFRFFVSSVGHSIPPGTGQDTLSHEGLKGEEREKDRGASRKRE
jgi:hypothetical protein